MAWRVIIGILLVVNAIMIYRIVHPETGLPAYRALRERIQELQQKIGQMDTANRDLSAEIRALRHDEAYVSRLVRRELLYAADDEIMYIIK